MSNLRLFSLNHLRNHQTIYSSLCSLMNTKYAFVNDVDCWVGGMMPATKKKQKLRQLVVEFLVEDNEKGEKQKGF